ncbi:MAG: HAMP domain-containing protein [Chloroflexi bacterium]|nr:HAMP domain-containing protein [Chloroflexota bacterium]
MLVRRPLSLRQKMVLAMGGLVLVLGLAGTIHARLTLSNISNDELDRRALAISRGLESPATELLLTNDIFGLYLRVNEITATNADVRYVVVFDSSGDVRASSFAAGLPAGLRSSNPVQTSDPYSLTTLESSEGSVRDLAYPIQGGRVGLIRLGLTKKPIESRVDRLTFNLLGLTGLALAGGLAASYFLGTVLTRPLSGLAAAARAAGRGESAPQHELYAHPEVGQVAVAFDNMTRELRERDEERTQLLAKVMTAQEDERRRISRELHDEAGQALTSLLLGLTHLEQSVAEDDARALLAELRVMTTEAMDLTRNLARELRPSVLDDLGLEAAVGRYVADYGKKQRLDTDFHSGGFGVTRLRPETETALYRIAQEALTNVARHAGASSVNVLLERRDGKAVLVVEDDGCGFDVSVVRGSGSPSAKLGLLGMEERASLVGGTLAVESRPGSGTAIFVEVPIDGGADERDAHPDS